MFGFRYTGASPQSPGKTRDYVSPTGKPSPAAEKLSRTEERPDKVPRADETTPSAEKPKRPEKSDERPAAGKPSRPEDKPRKPDDKPRRGDQSPDSLEEDDVQLGKLPDILSKIPLKEQCICELCTCG